MLRIIVAAAIAAIAAVAAGCGYRDAAKDEAGQKEKTEEAQFEKDMVAKAKTDIERIFAEANAAEPAKREAQLAEAIEKISWMKSRAAGPILAILDEPESLYLGEAALAAGRLKIAEAVPKLIEHYKAGRLKAECYYRALGDIPTVDSIRSLREDLEALRMAGGSVDKETLLRPVRTLAAMGKEGIAPLIETLGSENVVLRLAAYDCLSVLPQGLGGGGGGGLYDAEFWQIAPRSARRAAVADWTAWYGKVDPRLYYAKLGEPAGKDPAEYGPELRGKVLDANEQMAAIDLGCEKVPLGTRVLILRDGVPVGRVEVTKQQREPSFSICGIGPLREGLSPRARDEAWCRLKAGTQPYIESTLVKADPDGKVVIGAGSSDGVEVGFIFVVFRKGEFLGKLKVVEVSPEVSTAEAIPEFKKGDLAAGDGCATRLPME